MPPLNDNAARAYSEQPDVTPIPGGDGAPPELETNLEEVLQDIAADARAQPTQYLDDTRVPAGG